MEIHKPKPWHGWREFLKEYFIIVMGVLTALGAEQAAEAVHTSRKAAEAEALVREEFARNISFVREKLLIAPCVREQLNMVQRLLVATPLDQPVVPLHTLHSYSRPFAWSEWQAAVASGLSGHFPAGRRLAYQAIYVSAQAGQSLNDLQASEQAAESKLNTLSLPARKLDAATREQLLQAAAQAKSDLDAIVGTSQELVGFAELAKLGPGQFAPQTKLTTPDLAKACLDSVKSEEAALPLIPVAAPSQPHHRIRSSGGP
jgi:hypothetical protein